MFRESRESLVVAAYFENWQLENVTLFAPIFAVHFEMRWMCENQKSVETFITNQNVAPESG